MGRKKRTLKDSIPNKQLDIPCPFCQSTETGMYYSTVSSIMCRNCGKEVYFPKIWRNWDDIIAAYSKRVEEHEKGCCPFCGSPQLKSATNDIDYDGLCLTCGAAWVNNSEEK